MKRKARRKQNLPLVPIIFLAVLLIISFVSVLALQGKQTVVSKAEDSCPGKLDVTGACNPACCDQADPKTCPDGEVCSIQNGYCKGGFSCNPKENKVKRDCIQNICAWVSCKPDDKTCCDSDKDPNCMYCDSNEECVGVNVTPSPTPEPAKPIPNDQRSNTCFNLSVDAEAKKEQGGYTFYPSLKVESPPNGKDGHIQLFVDGGSKATNYGWNKSVHNPYVIGPNVVETRHVNDGQVTVNYAVKIDECDKLGNYLNLSCRYAVSGGKPSVEGPGCSCTNCDNVQPSSSSSSSSSKSSSSSSSSSKPKTPDTTASTLDVKVVFSYTLEAGAEAPIFGGVCLERNGGNDVCQAVDISKKQQTLSFTVNTKDKTQYTALTGFVFDKTYHSIRFSTEVDLSVKTSYGLKVTIGNK